MLGDNTSITNEEVPVLASITANCIGQFSRILTNNLNVKAPIDICVYDDTVLFHTPPSLVKKDTYSFSVLCGENNCCSNFFMFSRTDSLYTISKLTPYRRIFPTMYNNMAGPVSINFLTVAQYTLIDVSYII